MRYHYTTPVRCNHSSNRPYPAQHRRSLAPTQFVIVRKTQAMNRSISLADWGLLLAASLLVGSTFLSINIAVKEISPLVIAALRALMSALICWAVMRRIRRAAATHPPGMDRALLVGSPDGSAPLRHGRLRPAAY